MISNIRKWLLEEKVALHWGVLIVLFEIFLSIVILMKIAYTEIDWKAYMEEVEGFLEGERDYTKIRGNTGPLVYPAGFLYVFTVLRYMTNEGKDIFMAQCVFLVLYIMNLAVVLGLYSKSGKIPAFLCLFLTLSKRIHSIFILRMFNDCVAAFLGYCAVLLYCYRQWRVGSLVYSAAVSIKMNMLLYAPGVFVILLLNLGLFETVYCIGLCALVQFVLGAPFLLVHPISYIKKAFELSRVFEYKWTVNYKFLPEAIFLDKKLSIGLLVLTVIAYALFLHQRLFQFVRKLNAKGVDVTTLWSKGIVSTSEQYVINTILGSNLIGVVFARTLHYQFYSWYFHSIPLLLWQSKVPFFISASVMFAIEIAFNVFPATSWSSMLLQGCHLVLLYAVLNSSAVSEELENKGSKKSK